MLLHEQLPGEFYQKILSKCTTTSRVLIICALDVDALCACKILQTLFMCDNIQFDICPISSQNGLYETYWKHKDDHEIVILLNCGGTTDMTEELLDPEDDNDKFEDHGLEMFIIDSHRPLSLVNIFTDKPLYVVLKQEDEISLDYEAIPKFEQIFREDNHDQDMLDESEDPQFFDKEQWLSERKRILDAYSKFHFYSTSSAYTLFDLAWRMSKDTNQLLWLAILGVAEQYHNHRITREKYTSYIVALIGDQKRLRNQRENIDNLSVNVLKLEDSFELDLVLYRQWSIVESLAHSPAMFINFRLWSEKGERRLLKFLGDMGLPLHQAKQNFTYMDNEFVEQFKSLFTEALEKHNISQDGIKTFLAKAGYQEAILAQDVVWALDNLLKSHLHSQESSASMHEQQFFIAFQCLEGGPSQQCLAPGFNLAKSTLHALISNIRSILTTRQIQQVGGVLYYSFPLTNPDLDKIAPVLTIFTKILRDSFIKSLSHARRKIAIVLPLLVCIPRKTAKGQAEQDQENQGVNQAKEKADDDDFEKPDKLMIYACPPASQESCNTLMPLVFEHTSLRTHVEYEKIGFDPSFVQIPYTDKHNFIETITAILSDM